MASNLTTFALYTPALALVAGSGLLLRQQGIAALTILVITLTVACVPLLLLAAVVPGASTRLLPWLGGWMTANNRWIQVVLGFGIWLLVKGVNGLWAQGDSRPRERPLRATVARGGRSRAPTASRCAGIRGTARGR
jgi:ABC-type uncharacterized transport system permease subunit